MKNTLAILALILALCSCHRGPGRSILPRDCELRTGDVVFRRGSGIMSRAVTMADGGGAYSHVGIVVDSAGTPMIVHAVPDEPDYEGDPDRVKMDTPERFFSSTRAEAGEVRRLEAGEDAKARAAAKALEIYHRGTLFDHDYDDRDTTRVYCCELVLRAYESAGVRLAGDERHEFSMPGRRAIRCVLPSDIARNGSLRKVISF